VIEKTESGVRVSGSDCCPTSLMKRRFSISVLSNVEGKAVDICTASMSRGTERQHDQERRTSSISIAPGPPAFAVAWQFNEKAIQKARLTSCNLLGSSTDDARDAKRSESLPARVLQSKRSYRNRLKSCINRPVVRIARAAQALVNS